jgi:hypothetical protein
MKTPPSFFSPGATSFFTTFGREGGREGRGSQRGRDKGVTMCICKKSKVARRSSKTGFMV